MKKIFTLFVSLITFLGINADNTDVSTMTDALYINFGNISITESTSTVDLMMITSQDVQTAGAKFVFPDGIKPISIKSICDVPCTGNFIEEGNYYKVLFNYTSSTQKIPTCTTPICVAKITVQVDASKISAFQKYTVNSIEQELVGNTTIKNSTDITMDLTAQRAAVIEPMTNNYALEIIPFKFSAGGSYNEPQNVSILIKNTEKVKTLDFDFELPTGIEVPSTVDDGEIIYAEPELDNVNGTPSAEITKNSDGSYHYSFSGTSTKYIKIANEMTVFSTLPLMSNSSLTDGVYTIKIKNIEDNSGAFTGSYYTSVFVGTPTQTDPIVYGHYTTTGQAALKAASTNFASIDMSEATIDATEAAVAADLTGKLIYGPEKTSYNRSVTGYGTVCLPFALTSNSNVQYYTLISGTSDKLIFEEAETVAANTPALVKGNIVASADGYQYASAPVDGTSAGVYTMKGTYKKINIPEKTTYYIANNKFWNDGATVAPFRGYLTGTSGSSKLSILIDDATGLHEITDQLSSEDIYNLQGIKLSKTQKGVNIIGGKKILVK